MFQIEISKPFKAKQGLKSPVRNAKDLPALVSADGFDVIMRVGIGFKDKQLKETGWFIDTDTAENHVISCCDHLSSQTWTELFEFRPTFELVSKWLFESLKSSIPQLSYVELENRTIEVKTRYGRQP